eukprot:CAMPEP_0168441600 /NCGR_PEP_ID=MMETSP0228-20121227/43575_1 /TAXON_ID=133427 /ORGANISM="Protoceratium reticulatum, Strain CCCM 535 (=CCMP 1889)" /LENGTH=169 /DNA_ID=CAMNT_0008455933 /DNA_START=181 /DNA_END=687 /DNA_ORIENTATION=+
MAALEAAACHNRIACTVVAPFPAPHVPLVEACAVPDWLLILAAIVALVGVQRTAEVRVEPAFKPGFIIGLSGAVLWDRVVGIADDGRHGEGRAGGGQAVLPAPVRLASTAGDDAGKPPREMLRQLVREHAAVRAAERKDAREVDAVACLHVVQEPGDEADIVVTGGPGA